MADSFQYSDPFNDSKQRISGLFLALTDPSAYSAGDWFAFVVAISLALLGLLIFFEFLLK